MKQGNNQRYNKYSQVESDLRRRILSGEFSPEMPLPGEQQLRETYGVCRKTVRKALENLRSQNYIRKKQGRGSFVIPDAERRLMPRMTGKIRLMLPSGAVSSSFEAEIAAGVQKLALTRSLEISFGSHQMSGASLIDLYRNFSADAFIWCAIPEHLPPAVEELARLRIPQILIDEKVPGTGCVIYDSTPAWESLLQMLYAQGHRHLGFFERFESLKWVRERQESLLRTADRAGMSVQIFAGDFADSRAVARILQKNPAITAYVCINPWKKSFLRALEEENKAVPEHLSWAEFTPEKVAPGSPVTAIHIPTEEMGWQAAYLAACHDFAADPEPESAIGCFTVAGKTCGSAPQKMNIHQPDIKI